MTFERTVREIDGDYAVLVSDDGAESRTALALLPDGITEGTRLVFENFESRIKKYYPRPPQPEGRKSNTEVLKMIRHVIMWKFREGEEENMHRFLNGLKSLDGVIPEIRRMEVGVNVLEKNNYDACLIADFDDLEALERYKKDPRHVAVSTLCKSIREARGAVDFEI